MPVKKLVLLVGVLAVLGAAPQTETPATPDPMAESRRLFLRAREAMVDGRFQEALDLYRKVIERLPPARFVVEYLGGTMATFELADDGAGGTDLTLNDIGVPEEHLAEVSAGWVSVLLALKAAVDCGVDQIGRAHV